MSSAITVKSSEFLAAVKHRRTYYGIGKTLIDDDVRSEWNVPAEWKLIAQMPFGSPTQQPGIKISSLWKSA